MFKNRIINGAMVIDQRNAGASVTPVNAQYLLDRWQAVVSASSKYSVQQNAGAVTPPTGFTKYLGVTSLSAYTVGASEIFNIAYGIEGLNVADLGWGTASASTITISFWVRSSLTGTFGLVINNASASRSYPASYTISSANTWEQKTITIAGDTSGTWATDNTLGIQLRFGLGVGSTYSGAAGSWSGSSYYGTTGATSVVGTSGATFYITGVQLEKGSTATSFDYRPYGTELQLCQRYFQKTYNTDAAIGLTTSTGAAIARANASSSPFLLELQRYTQVVMRATPTVIAYSTATGTAGRVHVSGSDVLVYSMNDPGMYSFGYPYLASGLTAGNDCRCQYTATAEL